MSTFCSLTDWNICSGLSSDFNGEEIPLKPPFVQWGFGHESGQFQRISTPMKNETGETIYRDKMQSPYSRDVIEWMSVRHEGVSCFCNIFCNVFPRILSYFTQQKSRCAMLHMRVCVKWHPLGDDLKMCEETAKRNFRKREHAKIRKVDQAQSIPLDG